MTVTPVSDSLTLRRVACDAGLSMADLAFITKLPRSTLSRLWDEENWLDRITGHSLKRLISVLPGLAAHLSEQSCKPRLRDAIYACADLGLQIRTSKINALVAAGYAAQRVILALETAAAVMRLYEQEATFYLARCWGTGQDPALDAILAPSTATHALFSDNALLLDRVAQLLARLEDKRGNSLHAIVGHGILIHKTAKLFGKSPSLFSGEKRRGSAFAHRSAVIGLLLGTGDLDRAARYRRTAERSPYIRANELWSLTTYAKDAVQTQDFVLPKGTQVTRTAMEIERDAAQLNEAYVYYLASTAVPILLGHDRSLGGRRAQLVDAFTARVAAGVDPAVERVCVNLARSLVRQ